MKMGFKRYIAECAIDYLCEKFDGVGVSPYIKAGANIIFDSIGGMNEGVDITMSDGLCKDYNDEIKSSRNIEGFDINKYYDRHREEHDEYIMPLKKIPVKKKKKKLHTTHITSLNNSTTGDDVAVRKLFKNK